MFIFHLLNPPREEIFKETSGCYSKYGAGLWQTIDEEWSQRSAMITDAECKACAKVGFSSTEQQESLCLKLQMCVCSAGAGQESFHCHKKMVQLLKPFFMPPPNKNKRKAPGQAKKKPEKPEARLWLEAGMLVLCFSKVEADSNSSSQRLDCPPELLEALSEIRSAASSSKRSLLSGGYWKASAANQIYKGLSQKAGAECRERIYFHVGYVNYTTWHFSGLIMEEGECLLDGGKVLHVPSKPEFARILLLLRDVLDLARAWKISFHMLRSRDDKLLPSQMLPATVVIDECERLPCLPIWDGSDLESINRKKNKGSKPRARGDTKNASQPSAPKGRGACLIPLCMVDAYDEADLEEHLFDVTEAEDQNDSDVSDGEKTGEEEIEHEESRAHKIRRLPKSVPKAKPQPNPPVALPLPPPPSPPPSLPPVPLEAAVPEAPSSSRVVASRVRTGTEMSVSLDGYGRIAFYPHSKTFTAFCEIHAGDCRRSRTSKESSSSRSGQGKDH